ncbi:hypothetical protein B0H10DRAFT_2222799 [Mycena sp. CBHHK59/15]|nr:hypothetical protein B0H10DRAFT_2222799 [Mycena sp. CBHHK59/15]
MLITGKFFIVLAATLSANLQTVSVLGAYFCNDINWTNDCAHWTNLVYDQCYTLDAGHQDKLSSFGPDEGTLCNVMADYFCGSSPASLEYPGSGDLRNVYYEPEPVAKLTV